MEKIAKFLEKIARYLQKIATFLAQKICTFLLKIYYGFLLINFEYEIPNIFFFEQKISNKIFFQNLSRVLVQKKIYYGFLVEKWLHFWLKNCYIFAKNC